MLPAAESLEKTGPGRPPFSLTLGAYSHAKQIPAIWHILFSTIQSFSIRL